MPQGSLRRTRAAVCLAVLLLCGSRASALKPSLAITQYAHTTWTIREGFFSGAVFAIAQTPDGYLWLGTDSGLLRFDGVRAVPWQPRAGEQLPSPNIMKLLVTHDGRLWIGTIAGLASWKDGRLLTYPELAGQPIASLREDAQRTLWAGTVTVPHARLCAIRGTVECVGQDGRFGNGVFSLADDGGTLWIGAATGLWRWSPDPPTRFAMPTPNLNDLIAFDGRLLIAMRGGVRQFADGTVDPYPLRGLDRAIDSEQFLVDRDHGLWIATQGEGLVHVHNGRADQFTRANGLSGDQVQALFEDREGNVWVGTNEGVDRFRELAVTTLAGRDGMPAELTSSVLTARDGSIWIGSPAGLVRRMGDRTTTYRMRDGLPDDRIGTLFEDRDGRLLVATLGGIAVFTGDRFAPLSSAPTRIVYGIAEGRPGELWIVDQEQGLIHLAGDTLVKRIPWSVFGRDDHATALAADPARGGLWLGFYNGGVAFLQDGTIRRSYGAADGLGAGRVSALRLDDDGTLWAATAGGLSRIHDERIATLSTGNGLRCASVHWMIADTEGSAWLSTACGMVRIKSADLAAWIADPARTIVSTIFDSSDGVRSQATPIGFHPPAARLPDGRVWFATANGLGAIDPGTVPFNTVPPVVQVEQIVADRVAYDTAIETPAGVRLPPRVHDLQIDYTALSFVAPEKVRFRYMLEGYDRDWQDVGLRRQAFYTDLPPRQYRFRVAAANNDGVWNDTGATIDFAIAPAYYQTSWFLALSAGLVVGLLYTGHRIRLRIVETHQREISALNERLMKAQEQERMRIAGELHDGVMQQMLAVTMMLGTAKRRIATDADARAAIDRIQDKMIGLGTDLRRLSHDLHPPILQEAGLPQAVRTYCEEFSATCGVPIACDADERARDLSRGAALALFRVLQEALGNAAKHASAKRIGVRLARTSAEVLLTVSDDGVGFDRNRLGSVGGLGLITMRERAAQLDGTFEFETAPARGTTIRVAIPFR